MSGIALFEDRYWQSFSPITLTRATFDIKVGAKSFFEEYKNPPEVLLTREYIAGVTKERHQQCRVNPSTIEDDMVFVNGLLHPGALFLDRLLAIDHTFAISSGSRLLVARLTRKGIGQLLDCVTAGKKVDSRKFEVQKSTQLGTREAKGLLSQPWEIISALENSLVMQVGNSGSTDHQALDAGIHRFGEGQVTVDQAELEEGTVLDSRKGGIYIGPQAHVAPSRIIGPAYIGAKSQIKQFSIIDTSFIGYDCRVGGEIDHSIISDHTNKAHAGYIGHSYVGEWVNNGAMTTTSDLKMTYGSINMNSDGGRKVDTGLQKVGSFLADMSKTSIGTLIYSGRRIGVSSHLHGLVSEDIPSFTLYGRGIGAKSFELQLDSAVDTQRRMMSRRDKKMTKAIEQMMRDVFSFTALDRKRNGVRKGRFSL